MTAAGPLLGRPCSDLTRWPTVKVYKRAQSLTGKQALGLLHLLEQGVLEGWPVWTSPACRPAVAEQLAAGQLVRVSSSRPRGSGWQHAVAEVAPGAVLLLEQWARLHVDRPRGRWRHDARVVLGRCDRLADLEADAALAEPVAAVELRRFVETGELTARVDDAARFDWRGDFFADLRPRVRLLVDGATVGEVERVLHRADVLDPTGERWQTVGELRVDATHRAGALAALVDLRAGGGEA